MAKREDAFKNSEGYTARKDYLDQFGIKPTVSTYEHSEDLFARSMDRLEAAKRRVEEQAEISKQRYEEITTPERKSRGFFQDAWGTTKAIAGSLAAAVSSTLRQTYKTLTQKGSEGLLKYGALAPYVAEQNPDKLSIPDKFGYDLIMKELELLDKDTVMKGYDSRGKKGLYGTQSKEFEELLDRAENLGGNRKKIEQYVISSLVWGEHYESNPNLTKYVEEGDPLEKEWRKGDKIIRTWANVDDQNTVVKFAAGLAESVPYMAATLLAPEIGVPLLFNTTYQSSMEEFEDQGYDMNDPMVEARAVGNGLITASFMYMWDVLQGVKVVSKAVTAAGGATQYARLNPLNRQWLLSASRYWTRQQAAKAITEPTIKNFVSFVGRRGVQMGTQRMLSSTGMGILAKVTTDKDKDWVSVQRTFEMDATTGELKDTSGAIVLSDVGKAGVEGFILGSVFAAIANAKHFHKSRKYVVEELGNKEMKDVTPKELETLTKLVQEDLKVPEAQAEMNTTVSAGVGVATKTTLSKKQFKNNATGENVKLRKVEDRIRITSPSKISMVTQEELAEMFENKTLTEVPIEEETLEITIKKLKEEKDKAIDAALETAIKTPSTREVSLPKSKAKVEVTTDTTRREVITKPNKKKPPTKKVEPVKAKPTTKVETVEPVTKPVKVDEKKVKQFEVIQKSNPAPNDTQTWTRSATDIKTAKEVWGIEDYNGSTPDFTKADADKAIKSGKVKVYSSMPIKNGVFVTPSKIEAQNYAGEKTIYEKTVPLSDVAWIDDVQGQYAKLFVDKAPTITEQVEQPKKSNKLKKKSTTAKKETKSEVPKIAEEVQPVEQISQTEVENSAIKVFNENLKESMSIDVNKTDVEVMRYMATTIAEEIGYIQDGGKSKYNIEDLMAKLEEMEKIIDIKDSKYAEAMKESSDDWLDLLTQDVSEPQSSVEKTPATKKGRTKSEVPKIAEKVQSVAKKTDKAPKETKTFFSDAEVISDKSSTGTVYRIGDKVYKSATFKGGTAETKEATIYSLLSNSDVIGKGKRVVIDGKPYIEMPNYDYVISIDEIKAEDRDMYEPIIADNIDRMLQAVQELSNIGYDYSDPLQFGYNESTNKLYLIDFSNADIYEGDKTRNVVRDNYNRLERFLTDFGFNDLSKVISTTMRLKNLIESTDYDTLNEFSMFIPEEYRDIVINAKQQVGDMPPNNAYYARDRRPIGIGNSIVTDWKDGARYVYTETPLTDRQIKDWELKKVYEKKSTISKVETEEITKETRQKKLETIIDNTHGNINDKTNIGELRKTLGDFNIVVKDVNGNRAVITSEQFERAIKIPEFEERVSSSYINKKALEKGQVIQSGFMSELTGDMDNILEGNYDTSTLGSKSIGDVSLVVKSTITNTNKVKIEQAIENKRVQNILRENKIEQVIIEKPYVFGVSEQGSVDIESKIIFINADAVNPTNTLLHELGHIKFDSMNTTERAELIKLAKSTINKEMEGYAKNKKWEEIVAESIYTDPNFAPTLYDSSYKQKDSPTTPVVKNKASNFGYHAGDLGKSESLFSQTGGRSTGHFGTGTYFVGDKTEIDGYNQRDGKSAPIHSIDFSGYNLFKPKGLEDGRALHDFLKGINGYWRRNTKTPRTIKQLNEVMEVIDTIFGDGGNVFAGKEFNVTSLLTHLEPLIGKEEISRAIIKRRGSVEFVVDVGTGSLALVEGKEYIPIDHYDAIKKAGIKHEELVSMFKYLIATAEQGPIKDNVLRYEEWESTIGNAAKILGVTADKLRGAINETNKELSGFSFYGNSEGVQDSASTRVMKKLGYEGVDVRGIKYLDNTKYGSVIYDLYLGAEDKKSPEPKVKESKVGYKSKIEVADTSNMAPYIKKLVDKTKAGSYFIVTEVGQEGKTSSISMTEFAKIASKEKMSESKLAKAFNGENIFHNGKMYDLTAPVTKMKATTEISNRLNKEASVNKQSQGIVSNSWNDLIKMIEGIREEWFGEKTKAKSPKVKKEDKNKTNYETKNQNLEKSNPDAYKKFMESKEMPPSPTRKEKKAKLKENDMATEFQKNVTLGAVPVSHKFAEFRRRFREVSQMAILAEEESMNALRDTWGQVKSGDRGIANDALFWFDATHDLKNNLYGKNPVFVQFGFTPEEVIDMASFYLEELQKPEYDYLKQVFEDRRRIHAQYRDALYDAGQLVGIDYGIIYANPDYVKHVITDYRKEFNPDQEILHSGSWLIDYLARTGSSKSYISDVAIADKMMLKGMVEDVVKLNLFYEAFLLDKSDEVTFDKQGNIIIPKGYSVITANAFGVKGFEQLVLMQDAILDKDEFVKQNLKGKKLTATIAKEQLSSEKKKISKWRKSPAFVKLLKWAKENNLSIISEEFKNAEQQYRHHMNVKAITVPTDIANAVMNLYKTKKLNTMQKLMQKRLKAVKYTLIRFPTAVVKYNLRNFPGDLEFLMMGKVEAALDLKNILESAKELYNYYWGDGEVTGALEEWKNQRGLISGQSIVELPDTYKNDPVMRRFATGKDINSGSEMAKRFLKLITAETFTEFREQILRYSLFKWMLEKGFDENGNPKKSWYMASERVEIDNLRTIPAKAFRMVDDLMGAYGDMPPWVNHLSDFYIPFFRFHGTVFYRNYQLVKNSFYTPENIIKEGMSAAEKMGLRGRIGLTGLLRLGKIALGVMIFQLSTELWNRTVAREQDNLLPEHIRNGAHITYPGWVTKGMLGDEGVYYFDRIGALSEMMSIFDIDRSFAKQIRDVTKGDMKFTDLMKQLALGPANEYITASMPLMTLVKDAMSKEQSFPDITKKTKIRDVGEYLAKFAKLDPEYRAIMGMPQKDGWGIDRLKSTLAYYVLPGDAALWDMYKIKDRFKAENGLDIGGYWTAGEQQEKKANAAYYYKLALKLEDRDAAEKYLLRYIELGGTKGSLFDSLQSMHPLSGIKASDEGIFFAWLNDDQKEIYNRALEHYNDMIKEHRKEIGTKRED